MSTGSPVYMPRGEILLVRIPLWQTHSIDGIAGQLWLMDEETTSPDLLSHTFHLYLICHPPALCLLRRKLEALGPRCRSDSAGSPT